ncbi:hypothetical protein FQA39_LY14822, partial [Lamprigera yunnana]
IKEGDFIIIQRQHYTKLQKLKENGTISLGKDVVNLTNVIGHNYYETFRMVPKQGSKRHYTVEKATELTIANQLQIEESGNDNRNIIDDGTSQGLTNNEIEELRDKAVSSSDIVEKLIANSKTFTSKTEYSQEKYLKKKEKKYFEYIQVRKPSIRLLALMLYRQDPSKTLGIRIDDLSQILTYSNVQSDGNFLLYDSGTSGLLSAALINAMGANTTGSLIHAHPGNECQKNALLAMHFPKEQLQRCINVNLYSVLRSPSPQQKKRLCWQVENERACKILGERVEGVVIAAKEHPLNIVKQLISFLKGGRTLVVFNLISKPLEELYFYLKARPEFININISNNFMRNYQVLPERTHPEVTMNFGGYILS